MKSSIHGNQAKAFVLAVLLAAGFINPSYFSLVHAETVGCEKALNEEFSSNVYLNKDEFKFSQVSGESNQSVLDGMLSIQHPASIGVVESSLRTRDFYKGRLSIRTTIDLTNVPIDGEVVFHIGREQGELLPNKLVLNVRRTAASYSLSAQSLVKGSDNASQITEGDVVGNSLKTTLWIERTGGDYKVSHAKDGGFSTAFTVKGGFLGDAKIDIRYISPAGAAVSNLLIDSIRVDCSQLPVTPGENLSSLRQTLKSEIDRKLARIQSYKQEIREKYRTNAITPEQRDLILAEFAGHITALEGLKETVNTLTSSSLIQDEATKVFTANPIARWERKQTQRRRLFTAINAKNSFAEAVTAKETEFAGFAIPDSSHPEYPLYNQTVSTFTSIKGSLVDIQNSYDQGVTSLNNLTLAMIVSDPVAYQNTIKSVNSRMNTIKQAVKQADVHLKTIKQNMNKMKSLSLGTPEG